MQIGDSGGIENTGYVSGSRETASTSTAGFVVFVGNAARAAHGVMEIVKGAGNQWFSHHAVYTPTICSAGGGSKTLSDTLTQVRLTRTGTDTLDGEAGTLGSGLAIMHFVRNFGVRSCNHAFCPSPA